MRLGFASVSLLDTRGQTVTEEHAGSTIGKLHSFKLVASSGKYTLETTADGNQITRTVYLRYGHQLHVELILSIT